MTARERGAEILLVENNPGDVRLTKEALKEATFVNNLHVVGDGVEALSFLHKIDKHADAIRPDLILLDLNMPRKDGREVLAEIKTDPELKNIPVVILTTSNTDEDVLRSYDLHANCYITKPVDVDQFMAVVQAIEAFWMKTVELPPN